MKTEEYRQTCEEVLKEYHSDMNSGLTEDEAVKQRQKFGENKLQEAKKKSNFRRFLDELKDPMLIMLIAAAIISAITNRIAGESMTDVYIIIGVVLLNAILGVVQESKAESAIEALRQMSGATCKVIRDGKQKVIPCTELVPGDIVVLEAGDAVPADGRLVEAVSLKVEESALTGESVPVNKIIDVLRLKDESRKPTTSTGRNEGGKEAAGQIRESQQIPLGDRSNMAFTGSSTVYGRGKMVVTQTGMNTEMGRIAGVLNDTMDEATPLQTKMDELGKKMSLLVIAICVVIFIVDLVKAGSFSLSGVLEVFMIAVSLAVAAIPEGLATVVTMVLSMGVTRMSKENAIVRRLTAVETLGCTSVICTDKTGTLTQNRMTVVDHQGDTEELARAMALCTDARVDEEHKVAGEPTEAALVSFADQEGIDQKELMDKLPRVDELPFDSMRKMMTTVHEDKEGQRWIQYTKGAPDVILSNCDTYLENGQVYPLTEQKRDEILTKNKAMADQALRVLAGARRIWDKKPLHEKNEDLEFRMTFLGLCGMIDPVRPEVKDAIGTCRKAGIQTVMITGDHKDTAVAIAKDIGIIKDASEAMTGAELDELSDEQLDKVIDRYHVYARVQPEHKMRIVKAWKKRGAVTAMTGDGVNDAPGIKTADIGIGMGITGTDVTKNVADMILTDDNFATIVKAVEEGRRIYDNIRKAIQFLLSSSIAEVIAVFTATLMGFTILEPVHLLFINLITDCFPALALGMEEAEPGIMERKPRDSKESVFAGGMALDIFLQGLLIAALTILSYLIGGAYETGTFQIVQGISQEGMTMAFLTLNMCELFQSFNMRSRTESIFRLPSHNNYLWFSEIAGFLVVTIVLEVRPIAAALGFAPISAKHYLVAFLLSVLVIPFVETGKAIRRKQ